MGQSDSLQSNTKPADSPSPPQQQQQQQQQQQAESAAKSKSEKANNRQMSKNENSEPTNSDEKCKYYRPKRSAIYFSNKKSHSSIDFAANLNELNQDLLNEIEKELLESNGNNATTSQMRKATSTPNMLANEEKSTKSENLSNEKAFIKSQVANSKQNKKKSSNSSKVNKAKQGSQKKSNKSETNKSNQIETRDKAKKVPSPEHEQAHQQHTTTATSIYNHHMNNDIELIVRKKLITTTTTTTASQAQLAAVPHVESEQHKHPNDSSNSLALSEPVQAATTTQSLPNEAVSPCANQMTTSIVKKEQLEYEFRLKPKSNRAHRKSKLRNLMDAMRKSSSNLSKLKKIKRHANRDDTCCHEDDDEDNEDLGIGNLCCNCSPHGYKCILLGVGFCSKAKRNRKKHGQRHDTSPNGFLNCLARCCFCCCCCCALSKRRENSFSVNLNKHELIIGHNNHNLNHKAKGKHKKNKRHQTKTSNRVENESGTNGNLLRNLFTSCLRLFSVNKWCECVLTSRHSNKKKKIKKKRMRKSKRNPHQIRLAHEVADEPVDDLDNEDNDVDDDDPHLNEHYDHMAICKHKGANQKSKSNRNTIKTSSYSSDECISNPPPVTCIRVLRPSNDLTPVKFDSHYNIIQTLNAVQNCTNDLTMSYSTTSIEPNVVSNDPVLHNNNDDIEELNETEEIYYPIRITY